MWLLVMLEGGDSCKCTLLGHTFARLKPIHGWICRDLRLRKLDAANSIWQADGSENSAIQLHTLQSCSRPMAESGTSLQRLAHWVLNNQAAVQFMRSQVQKLMQT